MRLARFEKAEAKRPDDAEFNVCGVLVHVRPERQEELRERLAALPGVEVHAVTAGRIVTTIEDVDGIKAAETLHAVGELPGVVTTALVYHQCERNDQVEGALS
ncbi:MAG: hypothetical protein FJX47_15975 [Alphaproteobacteria bacterium]|nr:hypothetical protein [Alphaproteobacteria bacterium]